MTELKEKTKPKNIAKNATEQKNTQKTAPKKTVAESKNALKPDISAEWQNAQQTYPEANFLQSPVWGKVNDLVGHKVIVEYNISDKGSAESEAAIIDATTGKTRANTETIPASTPSEAPQYWCQMIVKDAKRGRYLEVPAGP